MIGAGAAGAECTRILEKAGVLATLVDKGRQAGGRMASRRVECELDGRTLEFAFDHGAPAFSAGGAHLAARLDELNHKGVLATWAPTQRKGDDWVEGERLWTGLPRMNALSTGLLGTAVQRSTQVRALERRQECWFAQTVRWPDHEEELGPFDAVVSSAPAEQSKMLLGDADEFGGLWEQVRMDPAWTLMLGLCRRSPCYASYWMSPRDPWALLVDEDSKPGRREAQDLQGWVAHASSEWSREHLEREPKWVVEELLPSLLDLLELSAHDVVSVQAHRWRYARVAKPAGQRCFWSDELRLGACGDWCLGDGIGAAMTSGRDVARRVLEAFASAP